MMDKNNESMVSLVLRQYMRGENILLIQIGKQNVKIIEKLVEIEKCKNELFKMS